MEEGGKGLSSSRRVMSFLPPLWMPGSPIQVHPGGVDELLFFTPSLSSSLFPVGPRSKGAASRVTGGRRSYRMQMKSLVAGIKSEEEEVDVLGGVEGQLRVCDSG